MRVAKKVEEVTEIEEVAVEETAISTEKAETIEEEKDRKNQEEILRIQNMGGLRPNALFFFNILNWDNELETISIKFPPTSVSLKFSKVKIIPEDGLMLYDPTDILMGFIKNGLISNPRKFDVDNYPQNEVVELSTFITNVLNRPRNK